jgi:TonB-linked SusC/RagA family outer membrane protein
MNLKQTFRLITVILFFIPNILSANTKDTISVDIQQGTIKDLLIQIEQKTAYTFVYNNSEIDVNKKLNYSVKKASINQILSDVFSPYNISFQIIERQIILQQKKIGSKIIKPIEINGKVISSKDSISLPGVNVFLKGTQIGTSTDISGNFKLSVPKNSSTLVFSFLGYKKQEILLDKQEYLLVLLQEDKKSIDEVIIVGYGKESKKILSSSVSEIKAKCINNTFTSNISESIKGKLSGISVNQNSGTPGAAMTLRIRGISSITAGADPLYVIDGVPMVSQDLSLIEFSGQGVNTISDINLSEIESVSILKDASATAIYGARGSNGVVLITTERGNSKEPYIKFNSLYGLQQVANTYNMLNAEEFMRYKNNAAINDGGVAIYSEEDILNNTIDTDWQSELYKISSIQKYNLSFSGGFEKTKYFLNLSYFDQEGIVLGTDYKKISSRLNLDQEISDKLNIGAGIAITRSVNNRKEGDQSLNAPVSNAISLPPIYPIYNDDGTYNDDGPLANPISIANQHINVAYNWHNLGNIFAEYKILPNLSYKIKYGLDYVNFREHTYDPPTTRQGSKYDGLGLESTSEVLKTLFSNIINYTTNFDEKHRIDVIGGYEIDKEQLSSTYMRGELFASEELEYIESSVEKVSADAYFRESALNSAFGRLKYNFKNRYIFTLNARYDGSSRFSNKYKYGFFPSGDIAWRISDENFFNIKLVSDLKIRTSYGVTGNDKIPDFLYLAQFGASEYAGSPAILPLNIPVNSLKWETTKQFDIGVDLSLFKDRISLNFDYYQKKTEDLLLEKPIPLSSGFDAVISNIGKLENKGYEISLNSININKGLVWESELNISFNNNKVTQLYNNQPIDAIGRGFQRIEVGEPIGIFYGYNSLGVDPSTGDLVFEDLNNDGIIDVNDKKKIGSPHALFQGGFTNNLSYQNFDLLLFLQFSYGNDVFNGTRRYIEAMKDSDNQTASTLNRWEEPGDITDIPRATNTDPNENNRVSSRYIEDGSYLKIKSIKLNYNFEQKITQKVNIEKLSVFLLIQNLYTFTNYSGMDPEVNYAGTDGIRSGVEFFTYPPAKIFSAGLSIKF